MPPNEERVLLGLGSNLGERRAHMIAGLRRLADLPGLAIEAVSSLYETRAWGGPPDQGPFLNAAVTMRATALEPIWLMDRILDIERARGRERGVRNGPRTLDIDILLIGERTVSQPRVTVPHPGLRDRSFVLAPAAEIAGEMTHPESGLTLTELARRVGRDGLIDVVGEERWYHALDQSACQ